MEYIIGIDTGGTFTDTVAIDSGGCMSLGKAPTTPKELTRGVMDSLQNLSENMGLPLENLLSDALVVKQGSTIGTNILINRNGAKTGLITTRGHEDATHIMRAWGRVAGLGEREIKHQATARKPKPLVPKSLIKGITERVDCSGAVVVPLNLKEAEDVIRSLLDEGVDSIAVSLLWSFVNPAHELEIKRLIQEMAPDVYVQASCELVPRLREYARTMTTVIDGYIGPAIKNWFANMAGSLSEHGYRRSLMTMQASGGLIYANQLRPINSVNSGPAGGVMGSKFMAQLLGHENVITTDMGGTSFDVSLIAEWKPQFARDPLIHRFNVSIPMLNITAIGAGGGTIAKVDPDRGRLRVGPDSVGAFPGPACYSQGNMIPTVTDANVVLGYLNPSYFLGGRIGLDVEKSVRAVQSLGNQLGMSVVETAAAIYDIVNAHMSDLIRTTVTMSGYDPRDFVLFSFGGAGPLHACAYGGDLGVQKVYMFPQSAVFSAFGIASSDIQLHYKISERHRLPTDPEQLTESFNRLEKRALEELATAGFPAEEVILERLLDMKFGRQYYEETITVPGGNYGVQEMELIQQRFVEKYDQLYGKGAAYVEAGIEIVSLGLIATVQTPKPVVPKAELEPPDSSHAIKGERQAYFSAVKGFLSTVIYDGSMLRPGNRVDGPAIIEVPTTTIVIPPGQQAAVDAYRNVVVERRETLE